jgi:hypothetical protein
MSRIVTIAGALVDWLRGMIVTPMAAIVFGIILLGKIFDVISAAAVPSVRAVRYVAETSASVHQPGKDQTPLVHSGSLLTRTNHGCYGLPASATASSARPSLRAIAAALHGRSPR